MPPDLKPGEKRAGIVACHGYTGVRNLYLPDNAQVLNEAGYVVRTLDYNGWGDSDGRPKSRRAPRVADVQAALSFLAVQPEVEPTRLGLHGTSYGGATVASHDHNAIAIPARTGLCRCPAGVKPRVGTWQIGRGERRRFHHLKPRRHRWSGGDRLYPRQHRQPRRFTSARDAAIAAGILLRRRTAAASFSCNLPAPCGAPWEKRS